LDENMQNLTKRNLAIRIAERNRPHLTAGRGGDPEDAGPSIVDALGAD
jgi:hypothetical protein